MGAVYEAVDRASGATVAVKIVLGVESFQRFDREVRLLAALDHPAIVRHLAHGRHHDGRPWLAMEWLEGKDLADLLDAGPLSVNDTLALAGRVADALSAAHTAGVVHRDVKPPNIFLPGGEPGRAMLLDFGVARAAHTRSLTGTGMIVGTAGYVAPEVIEGQRADARADVFALGCVLYECLIGAPRFSGEHPVAVLAQALTGEPRDPREGCPACPPAFAQLVCRMMARDADARPADGAAVLEALTEVGPRAQGAPALTGAEQVPRALVLLALGGAEAGATITPEAMAASQQRLSQIAEEHGGAANALGDGSVVVVFSSRAAGAVTDLAERSVRCALALIGESPGARAAVAIGPAEIKGRWPVGAVVDRAVDLIATRAEPGVVTIDEPVERLLAGRFDTFERAGVRLVSLERSETRSAEPPMVGRARELAFLSAMLDECTAERAAQAALVLAPPGIGKSRLRRALTERAEALGWKVVIARGDPIYAHGALELLRQLAPAGSKLAALLSVSDRSGFEGAEERIADAAARWVRSSAPLLIVLEDLHWGDDASVRVIERVLSALRAEAPLLVLATARPEVDDVLDAPLSRVDGQRLVLAPLKPGAARQLVGHALPALAATVADDLVAQAQGNAFVIEELIRHRREGRSDAIPVSALAVAHARLDRLEPAARKVLRAGAVFGEAFWVGGVAALLGEEEAVVERMMVSLVRREVLERSAAVRFAAEQELRFRHGLLREASYGLLTEDDRQTGHRLAAEWLERAGEPDAQVIAEHFERGGDRARAAERFVLAADRTLRAGSLADAHDLVDRALALGAEGELRGDALRVRSVALVFSGGAPAEVGDPAREAAALLPAGRTASLEALAALSYAVSFGWQAQHRDALFTGLDALVDLAPSYVTGNAGNRLGACLVNLGEVERFHGLLGCMEARRGVDESFDAFVDLTRAYAGVFGLIPHAEALPAAERAIASFSEHEDATARAMARFYRGLAEVEAGLFAEARAHAEEMIRESAELRITTCVRWGRWLLAFAHMGLGEPVLAGPHLDFVIDSADRIFGGSARGMRSVCWLQRGAIEAALSDGEAAVEQSPPLVPVVRVTSLLALAVGLMASGQTARARSLAEEARALSERGAMRRSRLQIAQLLS